MVNAVAMPSELLVGASNIAYYVLLFIHQLCMAYLIVVFVGECLC